MLKEQNKFCVRLCSNGFMKNRFTAFSEVQLITFVKVTMAFYIHVYVVTCEGGVLGLTKDIVENQIGL